MDIVYGITVIFIFGLIFGKIFKLLKFPEVTGYLIAGILIGPYTTKILSIYNLDSFETFSTIALSFISFTIGAEFRLNYVKKLGKKPFIIGTVASLFTMFIVSVATMLAGVSYSEAILLGAIASSTAPAAIMMIVKEYHSKGEVTDTMLSVVAIDDVISILIFGFTMVIAKYNMSGEMNLESILLPFKEIFFSLLFGIILGVLLGVSTKLFKTKVNTICLILTNIFLSILISNYLDMSCLLMCMIAGCIFVNVYKKKYTDKILDLIEYIQAPLLIIFFVISGASLNFSILPSIGVVGIVFVLSRTFGKVFGSSLGAVISKSSKDVTKYLGPTLLSQTGLAIGLALLASEALPGGSSRFISIIIASSFVFDLIGPIITKAMLRKAKNI